MSDDDKWKVNAAFMDDAMDEGHFFCIALHLNEVAPGAITHKELERVSSSGKYKFNDKLNTRRYVMDGTQ